MQKTRKFERGSNMADKRFYWLKLNEDFFDENIMLGLRRQEHGSDLVLIYQKMLLRSLKSGGKLPFIGMLPTAAEEIAMTINEDAQLVQSALDFLERFGQVEVFEDGVVMTDLSEMTGSETAAAQRMRNKRKGKSSGTVEKAETRKNSSRLDKKSSQAKEQCPQADNRGKAVEKAEARKNSSHSDKHCSQADEHCYTEKEKEKEEDIDIEKELELDEEEERAFGKHHLALLSSEEYRTLVSMSSSSVVEKYISKYDKWLFSKKKQPSNGFEPIKSWIEKDLSKAEPSYDLSDWAKMAAELDPNEIPFLDG